jgi:hypothetical protein
MLPTVQAVFISINLLPEQQILQKRCSSLNSIKCTHESIKYC